MAKALVGDFPGYDIAGKKFALGSTEVRVGGDLLRIDWTLCGFGGSRPWLVCPGCGGRCRQIHKLREDSEPLCGKCADLAYASQRSGGLARLEAKIRRLYSRLKRIVKGPMEEYATRPKGMHRLTFLRILKQINTLEDELAAEYDRRFAKIGGWQGLQALARIVLNPAGDP